MTTRRVVFMGALALAMSVSGLEAAMPASCHMKGMAPVIPVAKLAPAEPAKMLMGFVKSLTNPMSIGSTNLSLAGDQGGQKAAKYCRHGSLVQDWYSWRQRNPHAKSRYDKKNVSAQLSFDPLPNLEDEEPDPDPAFGGCGCGPEEEFGKMGCGAWHANVWHLKLQ